jgi:hypothetical protein
VLVFQQRWKQGDVTHEVLPATSTFLISMSVHNITSIETAIRNVAIVQEGTCWRGGAIYGLDKERRPLLVQGCREQQAVSGFVQVQEEWVVFTCRGRQFCASQAGFSSRDLSVDSLMQGYFQMLTHLAQCITSLYNH